MRDCIFFSFNTCSKEEGAGISIGAYLFFALPSAQFKIKIQVRTCLKALPVTHLVRSFMWQKRNPPSVHQTEQQCQKSGYDTLYTRVSEDRSGG